MYYMLLTRGGVKGEKYNTETKSVDEKFIPNGGTAIDRLKKIYTFGTRLCSRFRFFSLLRPNRYSSIFNSAEGTSVIQNNVRK